MSKTFSPRDAGPDAWKKWHKDSFRLFGRMGPLTVFIFSFVVLSFGLGASHFSDSLFLLSVILMQCFGVILMIFCQHLVGQAFDNERPSFIRAAAITWMDIQSNPGYVFRRFAGQFGFFVLFIAFSIFFFMMSGGLADLDTAQSASSSSSPFSGTSTMMAFPIILQRHGTMSFSYWLAFKYGMSRSMATHYQNLAINKNPNSLSLASLINLVIYVIIGSLPFPLVSMILLSVFILYHASYIRCAYHDIFEDGTGLKEKERVEEGTTDMAPSLQA